MCLSKLLVHYCNNRLYKKHMRVLSISPMRTTIILTCLFVSITSYSQTKQDSSLIFEKSKGLLKQPLTNFIKVPQLKVAEKDKHLLGKTVTYITQRADSVKSIFEGKIVSIEEVGGAYLVMTQYGDYSIAYYGLSKPALKKGSNLKRNQFISTLSKTSFGQYFLTVQFYYNNSEVDPNDWLKRAP